MIRSHGPSGDQEVSLRCSVREGSWAEAQDEGGEATGRRGL